jgi:hypothetical protein
MAANIGRNFITWTCHEVCSLSDGAACARRQSPALMERQGLNFPRESAAGRRKLSIFGFAPYFHPALTLTDCSGASPKRQTLTTRQQLRSGKTLFDISRRPV